MGLYRCSRSLLVFFLFAPLLVTACGTSTKAKVPSKNVSCRAKQLQASMSLLGATQSLVGGVTVINISDSRCVLTGRPTIVIRSQKGDPIATASIAAEPLWAQRNFPEPKGWPTVAIAPGKKAQARLELSNWCGQSREPVKLAVTLPGRHGTLLVPAKIDVACIAKKSPPRLAVSPFEPVG